jgi:L-alanine-DL-glutamate epimerase-like enolase superfamily enzyme
LEITDLSVQLIRWSQDKGPDSTLGLVRVETDEGVVGHSFLGTTWRGAHYDTPYLVEVIKPIVLGRNPLNSEAIWQEIRHARRDYSIRAVGATDVALLDIAGQVAGLPVFRLLGAFRDRLPAYASTGGLPSPEAFAREALEYQAAGWPAYKIHPPGIASKDVDVAVAVRRAVGDNLKLMFDPVSAYSYYDALRVGLELQDLDYEWFEDPMDDANIDGYRKLCSALKIPVMATEYAPGGFEALHQWLSSEATDILRADVTVKGGITPVMKIAHLAEGFRMNCELHHGGNALANVANLHVAGAIANCDYYEVIINDESRNFGLLDPPGIDADGNVRVPEKPGLGVEIDFGLLDHHTIQMLK